MNLAYRDVKHNLPRFADDLRRPEPAARDRDYNSRRSTGAPIDDALRRARATKPDLWVVEPAPMGHSQRLRAYLATPGDDRARLRRSNAPEGSPTNRFRPRSKAFPLRLFIIGYELNRPGGPSSVWSPAATSCATTTR